MRVAARDKIQLSDEANTNYIPPILRGPRNMFSGANSYGLLLLRRVEFSKICHESQQRASVT
jgi:hypothetical protein